MNNLLARAAEVMNKDNVMKIIKSVIWDAGKIGHLGMLASIILIMLTKEKLPDTKVLRVERRKKVCGFWRSFQKFTYLNPPRNFFSVCAIRPKIGFIFFKIQQFWIQAKYFGKIPKKFFLGNSKYLSYQISHRNHIKK